MVRFAGAFAVLSRQGRHRKIELLAISRTSFKCLFTGVTVAEPNARHEIRRGVFVGFEVAIERQENEHVLLSI